MRKERKWGRVNSLKEVTGLQSIPLFLSRLCFTAEYIFKANKGRAHKSFQFEQMPSFILSSTDLLKITQGIEQWWTMSKCGLDIHAVRGELSKQYSTVVRSWSTPVSAHAYLAIPTLDKKSKCLRETTRASRHGLHNLVPSHKLIIPIRILHVSRHKFRNHFTERDAESKSLANSLADKSTCLMLRLTSHCILNGPSSTQPLRRTETFPWSCSEALIIFYIHKWLNVSVKSKANLYQCANFSFRN
jgi:hypothetical protein